MSVSEYQTSVDIANRALDHLGQRPITSFTDGSKAAALINRVYDKLRQAELRRNLWVFATKKTILRAIDTDTTKLLVPPAWSATKYYFPGQVVSSGGINWGTTVPFNYGNTPGADNTNWFPYFGPMTADVWDSSESYYPGDLVYIAPAGGSTTAGLISTYAALAATSDEPDTTAAYSSSTTYKRGQQVSYSGTQYISLIDLNLNTTPASTYALWASGTTYASGAHALTIDGKIWVSQVNSNLGNNPATDSGSNWLTASSAPFYQSWLTSSSVGASVTQALAWQCIDQSGIVTTLASMPIYSALAYGPNTQDTSRQIYRLPSGFLRPAPQQPKAGGNSFLGAPTGLAYEDWEYDGDFLLSSDQDGAIPFRFIADVIDVTRFDAMFCEGLAARIGFELCEPLTQSVDKQRLCAAAYQKAMSEARLVDAIISGETYPAEDDYLTARI